MWEKIDALNKEYEVSRLGGVRNRKTKKELKLITHSTGYQVVNIFTKTLSRKQYLVHRLVAGQFIDNPQNKPQINHKDGNKINNKVENLEWVTAAENIQHAIDTGLEKENKVTTDMKKELSCIKEWKDLDQYSELVGIKANTLKEHTVIATPRPVSDEVRKGEQYIFDLYLKIKNINGVARETGTTSDIVSRILTEKGIAERPNPRKVEVDECAIMRTFRETQNKSETARVHGVGRAVVNRVIKNSAK